LLEGLLTQSTPPLHPFGAAASAFVATRCHYLLSFGIAEIELQHSKERQKFAFAMASSNAAQEPPASSMG
jgi:hypothetical protein